jgi:hypothetical protein
MRRIFGPKREGVTGGWKRNAYKILVGKPEGKSSCERPRRRWEDNIKMGLREIGWENVDLIHMVQIGTSGGPFPKIE